MSTINKWSERTVALSPPIWDLKIQPTDP
jgi:hypothetical protein